MSTSPLFLQPAPSVGIIGGSGLYSLLEDARELEVKTPYGPTSSPITLGRFGGKRVAFLTRHGRSHALSPAKIPYRANIWALADLGVRALVSSSAVGGLQPTLAPGTFVVPTQYVDRTAGRAGTFFDGELVNRVEHLAAPDPFDPELREIAAAALRTHTDGARFQPGGTAVVIEGPRFATRAESNWYAAQGGDIINMTLAPEVPLALELGLGVVNVSFVTDSDAAVAAGHADAVSAEKVFERLAAAQPTIRKVIEQIVATIPQDYAATSSISAEAVREVLRLPGLN